MEKLTKEQEELQAKLLEEFMNPYYFGDQHDFAARAEILRLRERVAELEGGKIPARAKRGEVKED